MKTQLIIATLISTIALTGAAQATPNSEPDNTPFQGVYGKPGPTVSRARIVADLVQARSRGQDFGDSDNSPFVAQTDDHVTRAQVEAGITNPQLAFGDTDDQPFQQ